MSILRYGNVSVGDDVEEWHQTGNGPQLYREFNVTRIYRDRDMDGNIVVMICDDEECVNYENIKKVKK
jgi:hypothetical protein